jgi:hypothetical protein
MTAHDDLRRQLTKSVSARGRGRARAGRARGAVAARDPRDAGDRGHRWRAPRRALPVVLIALALGGGVAGAATQLLSGRTTRDSAEARRLDQQAVIQSSAAPVCQRATGSFVSGSALPEIERVFPARTAPISPALRKAVLRFAGGPVLERSVHLVQFPAGERLLVFATPGSDSFVQVDPKGCDRAAQAKLLALHPQDDAVRRLALVLLTIDQRRPPGRQFLTIMALGRIRSGGTGIPVQAGRRLPTGVAFSGGSATATQYGGIAVAGAQTVTLTTKPGSEHPLRRTIKVRQRLFAFTIPRATGPVTLRQRGAAGRTLATQRIRG